ncbi:MAG: hypothetical protein CR974_01425 [Gammaproteobacteria bacterium]|nr:MAG: hypothetical protein CR974_01425 [Gammaproteobacteria bacterium]
MNITEQLSIKLPLFQAPLTGYPNQDQFVTAICNHGALGVYSTDMQTLEEINRDIQYIQGHTAEPFAVLINLAETETTIDLDDHSSANGYLQPAFQALDLTPSEAPAFPDVNDVCKTVVSNLPPVLIFKNGIPTDAFIDHCKQNGITMFAFASNTLEAIAIDSTDIDGIILQGMESAGLQSKFDNEFNTGRYPIHTLLYQVKQTVQKPVVVWGDCQLPSAASTLLRNGARGVMLDVPFWTAAESPIPDSYRQALCEHNEMLVTETSVWLGQPTQVLQNALTKSQQAEDGQILSPGAQQRLMMPVIKAAIAQDNPDYMPLWAGLCAEVTNTGLRELCQQYENFIDINQYR